MSTNLEQKQELKSRNNYPLAVRDKNLWHQFKIKVLQDKTTMVDKIWFWIAEYVKGNKNF